MKGLTQDQMAEILGLSVDHIRRIESGKRGCSIDLLTELASYFGVSLDYLVLGKDHSTTMAKRIVRWMIQVLTELEQIV